MENYKELADRLEKRYKANETGSTFVTLCSRRDVLNAATAIAELMARAESAERQRDELAARYISKEVCQTCKNYGRKDCDLDCLQCTAECQCNKCEEYSMWEWNEIKEEQSW